MWAALPAIIAGGAALGGSVIDYFGQKEANRANARLVHDQMAFQERMSNTAYQRATTDMRAAGINPMMAYKMGGASTPPGASAVMQNPAAGAGEVASRVISTSLQAKRLQAEISLIENQSKASESTYWLNSALEGKALADQRQTNSATALLNAQLPGALNQAAVESGMLGKAAAYSDRLFKSIGLGTSSIKDAIPRKGTTINYNDNYFRR